MNINLAVRVNADLYALVQKECQSRGITASDFLREALEEKTKYTCTPTSHVTSTGTKLPLDTFSLVSKCVVSSVGGLKVYVHAGKRLCFYIKSGRGINKNCYEYQRFSSSVWNEALKAPELDYFTLLSIAELMDTDLDKPELWDTSEKITFAYDKYLEKVQADRQAINEDLNLHSRYIGILDAKHTHKGAVELRKLYYDLKD